MKYLLTPGGRRAGAFLAIVGGCAVFTAFAAVGVYLARGDAQKAFYLALAAHGQVLIFMTALAGLLVKRSFKISGSGLEFDDQADAAQLVADAAQDQADEVKS